MKFQSEAERLEHPHAKLIPFSLWQELFSNELTALDFKLLQLTTIDDFLMFFEEKYKPQVEESSTDKAWLCIALGNPKASVKQLMKASNLLELEVMSLVRLAAALGYLPLIKQIFTEHPQFKNCIPQQFVYIFSPALENGQLDVLRYLESQVDADFFQAMTQEKGYAQAFCSAAAKGHLGAVQYGASKFSRKLSAKYIRTQETSAFCAAAIHGHLHVVKYFAKKAAKDFPKMVSDNDFAAFRGAKDAKIREFLLNDSDCFLFAYSQGEYNEIIFSFMETVLSELKKEAEKAFEGVLHLDGNRATLCSSMILIYIKRNDSASNDNVRFLINIPNVKVIMQKSGQIFAGFARQSGNFTAAELLSRVDAVTKSAPDRSTKSDVPPSPKIIKLPRDEMKLIFKSEAERLEHPYAKLIPCSFWEEVFLEKLNELELKLLQSTSIDDSLKFFDEHYKPQLNSLTGFSAEKIWLCIALGDPKASLNDLLKVAHKLDIDLMFLLRFAVTLGYLPLVEHIFQKIPGIIKQYDYFKHIVCLAFENGHLNLLRYMESLVSADIFQQITKTKEYGDAFCSAAKKGHLAVVHSAASKLPSKFSPEYIQDQKSLAFCQVAIHGRLDALKEFAEKEPLEFHEMVRYHDFQAFRETKEVEVRKFLLNNHACFVFAHFKEEYKDLVVPFMDNVLSELKKKIEEAPNGVFDLNKERATLCYYMIAHYIMLNDSISNDNIRFLINIPAVKVIVQGSGARLPATARRCGNNAAVDLLSNIGVVIKSEPDTSAKSNAQPASAAIKPSSDKKTSSHSNPQTTTQTPVEQALLSNYEKKLQHCTAVGKAIVSQIERLQAGARSINPYWLNSSSKLDKILKAVNALPEDIDEKELAKRVTTASDPLYQALNTPRLSRITFLGQWGYDRAKSLQAVEAAIPKVPSKQ